MEHRTRVAVIGAGHAGIEAALAAARMGLDTVLFTINLDAVANIVFLNLLSLFPKVCHAVL